MILQQLDYKEGRMAVTTIKAQFNSLSPAARSLSRSSASSLSIADRAFLVQAVQTSLTEDTSLAAAVPGHRHRGGTQGRDLGGRHRGNDSGGVRGGHRGGASGGFHGKELELD
jgi:hypothetical protein